MTRLVGIVNLTEDSFSDGGRYLDPGAALAHSRALREAGADVVELGPASSRPEALAVSADEERRRLSPVLETLVAEGIPVGVDTWQPATQRWAIQHGARMVNDIRGFPDATMHPVLAEADCTLVVMHSLTGGTRATRDHGDPATVVHRVATFLAERVAALEAAGVRRDRLVVDPGMGLFLGSDPQASVAVLQGLGELRRRLALPVLISVSRKAFLTDLGGSRGVGGRAAATLAAELFAARAGAAWIRTHDVAPLRDALRVTAALDG
jgi:dihydropteroate synthase type 2